MSLIPKVSVLLPVRYGERTIDACLASLSAQTLREHEVIVVDDGSSDGTAGRLARIEGKLGLSLEPPGALDRDAVLGFVRADKKELPVDIALSTTGDGPDRLAVASVRERERSTT